MKLFRWRAIVPMLVFAALVVLAWTFYVDVAIRRAIEFVGTELVGAKVELASARLRLLHGDLELKGLQVTNPNAPMRNLVEVPVMMADLNGRALLMKKAVVESLVVHGVRFGTPRRTSGALKDLPPTAGLVTRRLLSWADAIPIPTLDLEGLAGTVIRIPAINADSLRTLREARAVVARGDSLRDALEQRLRGLDPRPTIDSAKALAERLRGTDPRRMNPAQIASTVAEVRTTVARVNDLKSRLDAAKTEATASVGLLQSSVATLDAARQADYAYARGLVNIPTLGAPDISMSLFGVMVKERLKPVLYWMNLADQYVPPGLDPRRQTGPERLRMAGTTFTFPMRPSLPQMLVERAEADLAIAGATVASGAYRAEVRGATSEPAVYGRPMTFSASRTSAVGPRDLRVAGLMDRTGSVPRDSVSAVVPGIQIPSFEIPRANARLDLGDSSLMTLAVARRGDQLTGVWRLQSDAVRWLRAGVDTATGPAPRMGSRQWAEALLWSSIATVRDVTVEARISGALSAPALTVSSNVGSVVSANLSRAVGEQVRAAEQAVRAEVDKRVNAAVAEARGRVTALESQVAERIRGPQEQLQQVEADLQQQLERVSQVVPGVRLPGLPGIPGVSRPRTSTDTTRRP